MQTSTLMLALASCLLQTSRAAPTTTIIEAKIEERDLIGGILGTIDSIASGNKGNNPYASISSALRSATPTTKPTNVNQASAALSSVFRAEPTPTNIYAAVARLVGQGLTTDNVDDILGFVGGVLTGDNNEININLRNPSPSAYPKADASDAPYDLTQTQLRQVIRIPATFKYGANGAPQPCILVPGTGDTGFTTFKGNMIPLLQGSAICDPVWLNIPGYLLGDAQTNAEYVAYAINYIYGISNRRKVAVIGWSQGNIDTQWALKFWPSTRGRVTDHVAFSPDYHGTTLANFVAAPGEPLPPSVLQQEYNSNFIQTLRKNGGDSGYVPTTTVYSGFFDEIVEPQQGTGASAFLLDARRVGVSNNEVQKVCAGQLAGTFYTHEGTLYNPLGFALLKDALANEGPGQASRLNLGSVCNDYLTPGLSLGDFLLTENSILIAGLAIVVYPNKVFNEPPIKSYAR